MKYITYMVELEDIVVKGYKCKRCGHVWIPRNKNEKPRVCPKCKSPYWDIPPKKKEVKKNE